MSLTKHYLVSGRVQGVGFRNFVQLKARDLNLKGWVRNLKDARVEVLAQGEIGSLALLDEALKIGPKLAVVNAVQVREIRDAAPEAEFRVREDGERPWFSEP